MKIKIILFALFVSETYCDQVNAKVLINNEGYFCEEFTVETNDGYLLTIHRIPYSRFRNTSQSEEKKKVVYLQHGLMDWSGTWVINYANQSLGFILADAGYDVWLGNMRGNIYGQKHKTLNVNSNEFWDFSWDDMAANDLPAIIYFILRTTGQDQLFYVGHSQGSLIGFTQFGRDKKLASKVKRFFALAPFVTLANMKSPLKAFFTAPGFTFSFNLFYYSTLGRKEFIFNEELRNGIQGICRIKPLCDDLFTFINGPTSSINMTRIPLYLSTYPASTSVKNMVHFGQLIRSGRFQSYDDGLINRAVQYDVKNVDVPVVLFYGENDWLVSVEDVDYLKKNLKNLVYEASIPNYDHVDFIWAINGPKTFYSKLIELIKSAN